nr:lipase maturation factor 2-like [Zootoca vivipara]
MQNFDKPSPKKASGAPLPTALQRVREYLHPYSGPAVIWSLYLTGAAICLLRAVGGWLLAGGPPSGPGKPKGGKRAEVDTGGGGDQASASEKNGQVRKKEAAAAEKSRGPAEPPADGPRNVKKKK